MPSIAKLEISCFDFEFINNFKLKIFEYFCFLTFQPKLEIQCFFFLVWLLTEFNCIKDIHIESCEEFDVFIAKLCDEILKTDKRYYLRAIYAVLRSVAENNICLF